ncbi:unnamed protein product [Alopecurus aequalis]
MAGGDQRKGKEPARVAEKFPVGMRVLAIVNNPICLKVLEVVQRFWKYQPTMVMDASTALNMLREGGDEDFDLVITDVHMPVMDGFELLGSISPEMDLPVIMISMNEDKETMLKAIYNGACDILVKPVRTKELKNIWQHVVRKNPSIVNHISSDEDVAYEKVKPGIAKDEQSGANSKKCLGKKTYDGDDSDENKESAPEVANRKRPRVSWTSELHGRFLEVVNRLGVDSAVPKTILKMMNVDYLTRESVASHLQKYRLYLRRVTDDPRKSSPLSDSFEGRNSFLYMKMNHHGSSRNYHEHQSGQPSSYVAFRGSNTPFTCPSVLGAHGVSTQSMNSAMGIVGHGGRMSRHVVPWMSDARRRHASGPPINSFAKTSDQIMLDAFPPSYSGKAYKNVLREKLLESNNVVPSSHPDSSFAERPNCGMLDHVNQFQVHPPKLASQFSTLMNVAPSTVGARRDAPFPCHVGSSSNPLHNLASSSFPGHMDGTPLAQSQVNISRINQLPSFAASPGQIPPVFQNEQQNQMEEITNNTKPLTGFSEQMVPFNMARNTTPIEMTIDNFSPMTQTVNGGSTNSVLPNLQLDKSFAPTQMVNGGSINSALPELQAGSSVVAPTQMVNGGENPCGTLPMQALADQPCYSDTFFVDDTFASMLNQDFDDDAFFDGGC